MDSDDLDDDDDDEDLDDEIEEVEGSSSHAEMNGTENLDGLRTYMDQMDQELMSTNIGQSFSLTVNYCCNYTQKLSGLCQYLGISHSIQSHGENTNKCHLVQHMIIYF